MVVISVSDDEVVWAYVIVCQIFVYLTVVRRVTVRDPESKETWRAMDDAAAEEFKHSEYSKWDYGAGEAIRNSTRILRVDITSPGDRLSLAITYLIIVVWSL